MLHAYMILPTFIKYIGSCFSSSKVFSALNQNVQGVVFFLKQSPIFYGA